ncbi:MAG: type I polyketide synthase [Deltaproteobacteria bacterium]|jgi:acyl transferase domain-containing protein/3-hydroxymyristoyl/3-hydroxydecanoyl-(acyl carrier protein) dehydratase|nr:type I polyketide synthase [Deltaproteobacteria bacterium]
MKNSQPIAIIGMGGIFPDASNPKKLWENILKRRDSSREVPPGRWAIPPEKAYDPKPGAIDRVYTTRGCFIDETGVHVDLTGLHISPDFLNRLDPLFRLLLMAGKQAFDDARIKGEDHRNTGVILGNLVLPTDSLSAIAEETLFRTFEETLLSESQTPFCKTDPLNIHVAGLPAGILSKALGLGGDSFTLDAACASSLYAMKLAVDELSSGRADTMLCGGVSRPSCLYTQMGFSQLRAISPSGRSAPFDADADGLVVGEGAGIFVLKRLSDALMENCNIYAVIRGIGLSNDMGGRLLAPTSEGQLRAMGTAYEAAGWHPHDVDLIECHATGTSVGDAVEFESLKRLWEGADNKPSCVLGSVKSNIGHLLTAAGAAACIKTIFALREKTLPPSANFNKAQESFEIEKTPFTILKTAKPWNRQNKNTTRKAAVSAFGFGGINAHVLLEEWTGLKEDFPETEPRDFKRDPAHVAVIGMDTHFGKLDSLESFKTCVLKGITPEPGSRDNSRGVYETKWFKKSESSGMRQAGFFMNQVEIPAGLFRIPPKELHEMLPQQLLMLKTAVGAWDDAGLETKNNMRAGTFMGIGLDPNTTNYHVRWCVEQNGAAWAKKLKPDNSPADREKWVADLRDAAGPGLTANRTMGGLGSVIASRIARELSMGGPCFTLSSEESSGTNALKTAVRALQNHAIDTALVGAVEMTGDVRSLLSRNALRPFSTSGKINAFDADAHGAIMGEGAGAVVLKRLEDAVRDKDRIYCVIKGIGASTGGTPRDLLPDAPSYVSSMKKACEEADCLPERIGYVETHGSGYPFEDKMEIEALSSIFGATDELHGPGSREFSGRQQALGSVKAGIGHTGAASSLASFIKAALCVYHEILPPLKASRNPLPKLFEPGPLFIPATPRYWLHDRADGPRRALVSSCSITGNCAHVLLEAFEPETPWLEDSEKRASLGLRDEGLFGVSAHTHEGILKGLDHFRGFVKSQAGVPSENMEALARLWWRRHRVGKPPALSVTFIAQNRKELLKQISQFKRSVRENPGKRVGHERSSIPDASFQDRVFYNPQPMASGNKNEICFVFPGSGNTFPGMGRELFVQWPEILRKQYQENLYLRRQYRPDCFWDIDKRYEDNLFKKRHDRRSMIFGHVSLCTGVSDLVQTFGIKPNSVVGYSLGETAGLFALKAWPNRDEMLGKIQKSTLFTQDLAGESRAARRHWKWPRNKPLNWVLFTIDRSMDVIRDLLEKHDYVYPLISNTSEECVIGGERSAVEGFIHGIGCRHVPIEGVSIAHCDVLKEVEEDYRELHLQKTTVPPQIKYYSGARGHSYDVTRESAADAILSHALNGVDFPKTIKAAYEDGARIFLEIGPGASCSRMINHILKGRPHVARSFCIQGQNPYSLILRGLGQCIAEGIPVNMEGLYGRDFNKAAPVKNDDPDGSPSIRIKTGGKPFVMPELMGTAQKETAGAIEPEGPTDPMGKSTASDELIAQFTKTEQAKIDAHGMYLKFSSEITEIMADNLAQQIAIIEKSGGGTAITVSDKPARSLTREQCMEYAVGAISKVFGEKYAEIDGYPTRVRLPDEPLMLVDRVVSIEGEPLVLGPSRIITEHYVKDGAWYLDSGRMPICITVEAGQADLMLSGFAGIDFYTKGLAVYRLLDADITFHRHLPLPGETIRYDIRIKRFFTLNGTRFFNFEYDGTIDETPLLTMRNGCAGFFTQEALAAGRGLTTNRLNSGSIKGKVDPGWRELVAMKVESYDEGQLDALRGGDLAACFGPSFKRHGLQHPLSIPGGRMKLVDRIVEMDPKGGRYGLGLIRAEADIHPDDWFLTCHFVDDRVMPGTLMYECCMHTLRIFLLRMGWIANAREVSLEPVQDVTSCLKCRGQVLETTSVVTYEIVIKELGIHPEPYAIADARMVADGKYIVDMENMSIRMAGMTFEQLAALWQAEPESKKDQPPNEFKPAVYDESRIIAFTQGKPSVAFGAPYQVFDEKRRIARLPRVPYQFLDRITHVAGEPWQMVPGGVAEAQYKVPEDAWYFAANRQNLMPFAVLLEIALQPCGWLAAYVGSALTSHIDLKFRNLGGEGVQTLPVTRGSGILTTRVKITNVSDSGGMIIQHFTFEVKNLEGTVYQGTTYFGFFSAQALQNQKGIQDAEPYEPSRSERELGIKNIKYPAEPPCPGEKMRMINRIDLFIPEGGPNRLGFIRGSKKVDPDEWFFKAHFYQDPVIPGSLGLEAFIQLLKFVATRRWGASYETVFEGMNEKHQWLYRGQVVPTDQTVTVEAVITEVDDDERSIRADGFLMVDGRVVYKLTDFTLTVK